MSHKSGRAHPHVVKATENSVLASAWRDDCPLERLSEKYCPDLTPRFKEIELRRHAIEDRELMESLESWELPVRIKALSKIAGVSQEQLLVMMMVSDALTDKARIEVIKELNRLQYGTGEKQSVTVDATSKVIVEYVHLADVHNRED